MTKHWIVRLSHDPNTEISAPLWRDIQKRIAMIQAGSGDECLTLFVRVSDQRESTIDLIRVNHCEDGSQKGWLIQKGNGAQHLDVLLSTETCGTTFEVEVFGSFELVPARAIHQMEAVEVFVRCLEDEN